MNKNLLKKINYNSCIAIIPARGGSKSVPKKNIRIFNNHPLIAYSIATAKMAENIERVIVSTDSEEIAEIALRYGAEVPFLRPGEYAQDDSPDIDFIKHAISWLAENENEIPEYLAHIRVTTPIRDYRLVDAGINMIKMNTKASSLRSGYLCVHPPYKWFQFEETGYMKPLFPGITCDEANMARQDFPKVMIPNSYIDVIKSDYVIAHDLMHGDKMIGFLTEDVPDIDTEEDLYKLEIYRGHKRAFEELLEYLCGCGEKNEKLY